jgi:general secretion pathway protein F
VPAFEYLALDGAGRRKRGLLEGDNARQVRNLVRQQGMTPLEVIEVAGGRTAGRAPRLFERGLSPNELALVTRQLSVLLRAGAPLEEALSNIARQNKKRLVQRVIAGVRSRVTEGFSLARALEDFPGSFDDLYRSSVEAGEESGHLELVLDRLADYTEARQATAQRLGNAMVYPVILTVGSVLVVAGLLAYVVPQVVQVFDSMGQELPGLTRAMLHASAWIQAYWGHVLVFTLLAAVAWRRMLRVVAFRSRVHGLLLRLPFVRTLVKGINASRFSRTLSILVASGVDVVNALLISSRVVQNIPMRNTVQDAARQVREGGSIHKALEDSGMFPPMTIYLIASGEQTGEMEEMLERAAQQQERETDTRISSLMAMFEPLLIMVMGAMVLLIVLAILLPIFELNLLVG